MNLTEKIDNQRTERVKVELKVQKSLMGYKHSSPAGHYVAIVGSGILLGDNDSSLAPRCKRIGNNIWTKEIWLPKDSSVAFKFLIVHAATNSVVEIESVPARHVQIGQGPGVVEARFDKAGLIGAYGIKEMRERVEFEEERKLIKEKNLQKPLEKSWRDEEAVKCQEQNFADRIVSDKSTTCVPNHIQSLIDKIPERNKDKYMEEIDKIPERNKDKYMEEIDKNIIIHGIDSDRAGIKKMVIGIADSSLKRLNINMEDMIKEFKKMGLPLSTPSTPYLQEGYSCYEIWLPKNSAEPSSIKDRKDENDIPPADREVQKNENEISLAGLDIPTIGLEERKTEKDIPPEGLDIPTVGLEERKIEKDIPQAGVDIPTIGLTERKNEIDIPPEGLDIPTVGLEERKTEKDIPPEGLDIPTVGLEERKIEKDIPQAGVDIPTIGLTERKNEIDIPPEGLDIPTVGLEERKNEKDIPPAGLDIPTVGLEEQKNENDIPPKGLDIPIEGLEERENENDIPPAGLDIPTVGLEEQKNENDIPPKGLDIPIEGLEERENENDIPTAGFEDRKNEINLPPSSHGEQSKINRYVKSNIGKKNEMRETLRLIRVKESLLSASVLYGLFLRNRNIVAALSGVALASCLGLYAFYKN